MTSSDHGRGAELQRSNAHDPTSEIGTRHRQVGGPRAGPDRQSSRTQDEVPGGGVRSTWRSTPTGSRCRDGLFRRAVSPQTRDRDRPPRRTRRARPAGVVDVSRGSGARCSQRQPSWTTRPRPSRPQAMYAAPTSEELILGRRIEQIVNAGATTAAQAVAAAQLPATTRRSWTPALTSSRSAESRSRPEHVSGRAEPLNLSNSSTSSTCPSWSGGCATEIARAAPDAHRRGWGARRLRRRFRDTTVKVLGGLRSRWRPWSRTWPPPGATTWTSQADAMPADRRRIDDEQRRRPGARHRRERGDGVGSPLARATQAPGCGYDWASEAGTNRAAAWSAGSGSAPSARLMPSSGTAPRSAADGSMNLMGGAGAGTMATAGYST